MTELKINIFWKKTEPFWPEPGPTAPRRKPLSKLSYLGWVGGAGTHLWVNVGYLSSEKFTDPRLELNFIVKFEVEVGTFFTVYIFIVHIGNFGHKKQTFIGQISMY